MRRVLLPLLEKTKEVTWRVMMVAEEGDADAAVEVSVEQDSVEVTEVAVGDSVVIGEGSAVAAEPGVLEEDSEVEEVDSVEVTTEERAAPNSANSRHHKFFTVRVLQLLRLNFFSFHLQISCSLEILLL